MLKVYLRVRRVGLDVYLSATERPKRARNSQNDRDKARPSRRRVCRAGICAVERRVWHGYGYRGPRRRGLRPPGRDGAARERGVAGIRRRQVRPRRRQPAHLGQPGPHRRDRGRAARAAPAGGGFHGRPLQDVPVGHEPGGPDPLLRGLQPARLHHAVPQRRHVPQQRRGQ